jgi:CPA1 family monovalent cation:H+ antiporter
MLIAVVILVALMALRLAWVWISVGLIDLKARRHGRAGSRPHRRLIVAMALAGVRGAVTLAGVLSVPLLVQDGSAFPGRELMVFIAAAVILLSLVIAAFGLPIVLKGLEITEDAEAEEERVARKATAEAAIRAIEAEAATMSNPAHASSVDPSIVAGLVIGLYQRRLDQLGSDAAPTNGHANAIVERRLRVAGMHAERATIGQLRRARRIDNGVQQKLLTELDLREAAIVGSGR